jgi:asparagine synthase (glutamine-hydrolysing)
MAGTIYHRGPDDSGYYSDGSVNMGMRRLSILDLSTGKQPIHNENKSLWTVFNGEIYNFTELRTVLEKRGHKFYTNHSDTELIVHLFEEYGEEFPNYINGMFAIALWDKEREQLYLIRDRMGVKPLFYSIVSSKLLFGSEIKTILSHPEFSKAPNFEGLYHYFSFKNVPAPLTAFEGVYQLLPGEMAIFSQGSLRKRKWWTIRFQEDASIDESYAKTKILSILDDATRVRMICDVPFGAYLSGGLDSSAVVSLMTRYSDKPVKTFSLGYEDELKNKEADLYYARKVSEIYKTEHYEHIMSSRELPDEIENVIKSFDQPFSGTISTFFLTRLMSRHIKVALSGDGADELFGSYLSHRTARPIQIYSELVAAGKDPSNHLASLSPCTIEFLKDLHERSGGDELSWRNLLYLFTDDEKRRVLSPGFLEHIVQGSTHNLVKSFFADISAQDPLNRILEMEWNTQLPDQVLAFVDFLSMAHSVEVRSPFLDYRLVEFAATIPGSMKISNGNVKDILKKALNPILPEGITARSKEGFVLPVFNWMLDKLKNFTQDLLSPSRIARHGLLNQESVNHYLSEYYAGNQNLAGRIWNLMMFQIWWESYFA